MLAANPAVRTRDPVTMPSPSVVRVEKKNLRLDDEMQFIRTWFEKPLSTGAVMPSSKALARTMARYVDPRSSGPVIEPVSYTHLRAHETDSYLVCRLLLE